jgi:phosphomannomutase
VRELFELRANFDEFDGVTVTSNDGSDSWWWFNVRSSNTEPLLRLNVEASTEAKMLVIRDEVLAVIRS